MIVTAYVGIAERIPVPGATTVTSGPTLENVETASAWSVEPTATTPGDRVEYAAGQITGPWLSLPVAAHRSIPFVLA